MTKPGASGTARSIGAVDRRPAIIAPRADTDDATRCLRYAQLERSYDPDNVFRINHNIQSASGPSEGAVNNNAELRPVLPGRESRGDPR